MSIYFTRRFILPSLPNKINITGKLFYNIEELILMFFAVIMLLSAGSMILKRNNSRIKKEINYFIILTEGLLIGLVTGLVGAGDSFFNYSDVGFIWRIIYEKSYRHFFNDYFLKIINWNYWRFSTFIKY